MRERRFTIFRPATASSRRRSHPNGVRRFFNRRRLWLSLIIAPGLVIGVVMGGAVLPANADDAAGNSPDSSSTPVKATATGSSTSEEAVSTPPASTPTPSAPQANALTATAPAADAAADALVNITVHAGGVRTGATAVGPIPNGAVFTATALAGSPSGGPFTCTVTNDSGTCAIPVPTGFAWTISYTTAAAGYYLNPSLDWGSSSVVTSHPYTFQTGIVNSSIDVPSSNPNATVPDARVGGNTNNFSGLLGASVNDPSVPQQCGLRIALVLDQSGSMAESNKQQNLKSAAAATITALTGTPSTLAIYTFSSTADTAGHVSATSTATASSAAPLQDFVSGLGTPSGSTNWDQGLGQVPTSGFDMVILLTDGAPTTYANDLGVGEVGANGDKSFFQYTDQGVFSANRLKASGIRLVGIGIGLNGAEDNLRAVSGPTAGSDYYLASTSDFGVLLKQLATGACNNTLQVQKQIQDVDGNPVPNSPDANGWNFTNTISSGTIAPDATTAEVNGQNGFASVPVTVEFGSTPTISVTEATQPGYTFVSAQCAVNGTDVATTVTDTTASFTGAANVPMSCSFVNRQIPTYTASVVVNKYWVINGTSYANGAQPAGYSAALTLTGQTNPAFGTTYTNYIQGDEVTVGEDVTVPSNCTNTPYGDIGHTTLDEGLNSFEIENRVTCTATVTLVKKWDTGSHAGDTVTLTINGGSPATPIAPNTGSTNATVNVNSTVTVAETPGLNNAALYFAALVCDNGVSPTGDGTFTMPNANVTCTYTNIPKFAVLTVQKNWQGNPIAGDTAALQVDTVTRTTSTSTGSNGVDPNNGATVQITQGQLVNVAEVLGVQNKGVYSQQLSCPGVTVSQNGTFQMPTTNVTCTFTNTAQHADVTLTKTWVGGVTGDTAGLSINSSTPDSGSTSTATGGDQTDTTHKATATVSRGSTVTLGEQLGGAGNYTAGYACTSGTADITVSVDHTFQMPPTGDVTCVVTNMATTGTVTFTKSWVRGAAGDQAHLSIAVPGVANATYTSTANGGNQTDKTGVTETVSTGSSVSLAEKIDPSKGTYTAAYACTNGDGTITLSSNGFRMPVGNVTCVVTNTAPAPVVPVTPGMANTGSNIFGPLGLGGLLLALGVGFLFLMRRRSRFEE